jgi:3-methyl-2-oxobutanoate hydroxymethyltransferase
MRNTLSDLKRLQAEGIPMVVLTSYDATFARVSEEEGVDVLLVGDSLGMVLQGHDSPNPVTLAEMCYHVAAVKRGSRKAFILGDMPFGSSQVSPERSFENAALLIQAGAQMVKIEGGREMVATVKFLTSRGIPVCAHLGMTPQSHHQFGGFKVQGRDAAGAQRILEDALALETAGADIILLECIPKVLADEICDRVSVPIIGIGASPRCSGQVLVLHDILGLTPAPLAKLAADFSRLGDGTTRGAIRAYANAVRTRAFPELSHCY